MADYSGMRQRTSKDQPCVFCGDIGYDMRMLYPQADGSVETVHWCHKAQAVKGAHLTGSDGKDYICISADKQVNGGGMGTFCLFREYLTKEEWRSRQGKPADFTFFKKQEGPIKGEVEPLSAAELHDRHTFLLSKLTLEEGDYRMLEKEWKIDGGYNLMHLIERYNIVSFPPSDRVRFANNMKLANPTIKSLMHDMCKEFGSPIGIPGVYERTGTYYDGKPLEDRVTMNCEGLIFPTFDVKGNLYRLRRREPFPNYQIKEGMEPFNGMYGTFVHSYDKNARHLWSFVRKDNGMSIPVWGGDLQQYYITVNENLCPTIGKVSGKYKNVSSLFEKIGENGERYNALTNGCKSGSPYSLYTQPGDSWNFVIATEGEKKGMVANAIKHCPVITVPGVGLYNQLFDDSKGPSVIDFMKQKGVKGIILCYDADKETNENVKHAETSFVEAIKKSGLKAFIGNWDLDKGLDDLLIQGGEITITMPAD